MLPRATARNAHESPVARVTLQALLAAFVEWRLWRVVQSTSPDPTGGAERSSWYMYFGDHPVSEKVSIHPGRDSIAAKVSAERWKQLLVSPW